MGTSVYLEDQAELRPKDAWIDLTTSSIDHLRIKGKHVLVIHDDGMEGAGVLADQILRAWNERKAE